MQIVYRPALAHKDAKVDVDIKRAKFLEYLANRAPCVIGMESCGGAHHGPGS